RQRGYVFTPLAVNGAPLARETILVGKRLSAIGKAARVVTNPATRKTASAHDLRRSFGDRWARRVMPATLGLLMRHESISTTLTCYAGSDAEAAAQAAWEAVASTNPSTNDTGDKTPSEADQSEAAASRRETTT